MNGTDTASQMGRLLSPNTQDTSLVAPNETQNLPNTHRCLLVPEIVQLICSEVDTSFYGAEKGKTLSALAQTCQRFQEPALDVLWHTLLSIKPLIMCMPSNLWKLKKKGRVEYLELNRPIAPTDWPRFLVHAQRVRVFVALSYRGNGIEHEAYQALDIAAESKVLLPNLRKLDWSESSDQDFPFIRLFLGPKIRDLKLLLNGSPLIRLSLLPTLCSRYPMLTHLEFRGFPGTGDVTRNKRHFQMISTTLRGWHHLRCLTVGRITSDALIHIATLSKLHTLALQANTSESPRNFPLSGDARVFPSLRHLSIDCTYMKFCIPLILSMSNQGLRSITISANRAPRSSWRDLCIALNEHCAHDALQMAIFESSGVEEAGNHDTIFLRDIEPLLAFSHLTTVRLTPTVPLGLRDKDMEAIALAWPHIVTLSLDGDSRPNRLPTLTLQGFVPLAKHCKELEYLTIFFCARTVPPRKRRREVFDGFSDTVVINVVDSPIDNPKDVAVFLSRIFPNIVSLDNEDRMSRDDDDIPTTELDKKWSEVEDLLGTLIAVRSEEREHWEARDADSEESDVTDAVENEESDPSE